MKSVGLALCILACVAPAALAAPPPIYQPVVRIGTSCATPCKDLTTIFTMPCAQCLEGAGQFAAWTNESTPFYSLKRMPFAEAGLKHTFAIPLITPPPYFIERLIYGAFNARKEYTNFPKNVTICHKDGCTTRNAGPDSIEVNASTWSGFCYTGNAWVKLDPPCDGREDPLENITWNTPEQLASLFTTNRNQTIYSPIAQAYSRRVLTDVTASADSVWRMANTGWTEAMYFQQLSSDDLARLRQMFGSEWSTELTDKLNQGVLAQLDFTWLLNVSYGQDTIPTFQPWPLTVFERVTGDDGKPRLRAIIVRLADPRKNAQPPTIFTVAKNPQSFIVALVYVRSALSFHQIWLGHFYQFHISTGAVIYSFYNNVDPGVPLGRSRHPLRMLMDAHLDPILPHAIELWSWTGLNFPAYAAITNPYHPVVFNHYTEKGPLGTPMDLYHIHPRTMIKSSKLNKADWTPPGGEDWNYYEQFHLALNILRICEGFVKKVIDLYYPNDNAVRNDNQIQNFVRSMKDPMGGNLGRINELNKITTKQELIEFWGHILHNCMMHNNPRFQDFAFQSFFNIPVAATRVDAVTLPDPARRYTLDDIMTLLPNMRNTARVLLIAMLAGPVRPPTYPWMEAEPGNPDVPIWDSNLPFPVAGEKNKKANRLAVQFRKDIMDYYTKYPIGLIRDIDTTKEWTSWQGFSANMDF